MLQLKHTYTQEVIMSSGKTPYEIRLELLKLAKESLYESVYGRRDALLQEYHAQRETVVQSTPRFPTLPDFPKTQDIIQEAEKLNKFISQQ